LTLAVGHTIYLWVIKLKDRTSNLKKLQLIALLSSFLVIGLNAYGVYQRNIIWHTEESLWLDVTIKSPNNGRGLMNYGLTQMAKGNYADADIYFLKHWCLTPIMKCYLQILEY